MGTENGYMRNYGVCVRGREETATAVSIVAGRDTHCLSCDVELLTGGGRRPAAPVHAQSPSQSFLVPVKCCTMSFDERNNIRSEEIRGLLSAASEADQLAENDEEILQSDDDVFVEVEEEDPYDTLISDIMDVESESGVTSDDEQNTSSTDQASVRNTQADQYGLCSWKHSGNEFEPKTFEFDKTEAGITIDTTRFEGKEIDLFHTLFDYDLVSHISEETNKYAKLQATDDSLSAFSKVKRWVQSNPVELFFSCLIAKISG
ncbi:hypothetical protein J6590_088915 [Homalodisca vitripennis]|nr:hypothetical protein J6590_088915 [Homalodisca vitripennis]